MPKIAPISSSHREYLINHDLRPHFEELSHFPNSRRLFASSIYAQLKPQLDHVTNDIEYGFYHAPTQAKPFYRAIAWNVERGIFVDDQIQVMKNLLPWKEVDLFFITETDIGMARTQNRNIARDMAQALGMNYFFAPSYLNFCKGNSVEGHYEGDNDLALHGNAILSRYPLENLRLVCLKNCKDKMKGKEKRVGGQKALIAEAVFPQGKMTVVTAHLDAHSSQRQRAEQMEDILKSLENNPYPVLLGGDLNTSCYNARKAVFAFFGFWNKVFRGSDGVIEDHYPHPYRYYDRFVFKVMRDFGMDYETVNAIGEGTLHYTVDDMKRNNMIQEVVPNWCRRIMEETLRRHGGKVSLKLDWFVARRVHASHHPQALKPQVLACPKVGDNPLSDHDAILLDFEF